MRLRRRRHGLRVGVVAGGDEDLLVDAGGDLRGQQHLVAIRWLWRRQDPLVPLCLSFAGNIWELRYLRIEWDELFPRDTQMRNSTKSQDSLGKSNQHGSMYSALP